MALRYRDARNPDPESNASVDVTRSARDILGADDDTVVRVARPHCGDRDCGEVTTILLLRPDTPATVIKIAKSLETVTEEDLWAALLADPRHDLRQRSQRDP